MAARRVLGCSIGVWWRNGLITAITRVLPTNVCISPVDGTFQAVGGLFRVFPLGKTTVWDHRITMWLVLQQGRRKFGIKNGPRSGRTESQKG